MSVERQRSSRGLRFGKWAGLYLGLVAAFADQQIVSTTVYARCPEQTAAFVISVGAVCAVIALIGAVISWRTRASLPAAATASAALRTDRFVATLCAALAIVCLLVIVFGTPAGLILRCEKF